MKRSETRILTTHTGSLPRSPQQQDQLRVREDQQQYNPTDFQASVREAVAEVVQHQQDIGLDVINDGEQGRSQYATYVKERLTGFDGERLIRGYPRLDDLDFPEYAEQRSHSSSTTMPQPTCSGPIAWKDREAMQQDIENLKTATADSRAEEIFMTAASPGVIANFLPNDYYPTEEAYLYALADVMREEYAAIVQAGFILQLDCPDLAMSRVSQFSHLSVAEFKKIVELHVAVINHALAGLPEDRMRMHMCWGNIEAPTPTTCPCGRLWTWCSRPAPWASRWRRPTPATPTSGGSGRR